MIGDARTGGTKRRRIGGTNQPVNGEVYDKTQIMMEAQEWLTTPNRAVELYKRGEPTFDLDRFQRVLMPIPDSEPTSAGKT